MLLAGLFLVMHVEAVTPTPVHPDTMKGWDVAMAQSGQAPCGPESSARWTLHCYVVSPVAWVKAKADSIRFVRSDRTPQLLHDTTNLYKGALQVCVETTAQDRWTSCDLMIGKTFIGRVVRR